MSLFLLKHSEAVKSTQVDVGSHLNVSAHPLTFSFWAFFPTTSSSSAQLYHLENYWVQLQILWKSRWVEQGVHSPVPQPLSAFHLCCAAVTTYMSVRGRGGVCVRLGLFVCRGWRGGPGVV